MHVQEVATCIHANMHTCDSAHIKSEDVDLVNAGGHQMKQQITTFEHAWSMLADGGVWITEDTATSYDGSPNNAGALDSVASYGGGYGGGYGKNDTWCVQIHQAFHPFVHQSSVHKSYTHNLLSFVQILLWCKAA